MVQPTVVIGLYYTKIKGKEKTIRVFRFIIIIIIIVILFDRSNTYYVSEMRATSVCVFLVFFVLAAGDKTTLCALICGRVSRSTEVSACI